MIRIDFSTTKSGKIYTDEFFIYFKKEAWCDEELYTATFMGIELIQNTEINKLISYCTHLLNNPIELKRILREAKVGK